MIVDIVTQHIKFVTNPPVHVKPFPKRKMFSCVWLHFKKFSGKYFLMFGKEEGKDKPKKNIINDRDPRSRSRRRDQRHDLAIDVSQARDCAISRSTCREIVPLIAISVEGEIAINCAISRRREIAPSIARSRSSRRSSDWSSRDRRRLELGVRRRSSD